MLLFYITVSLSSSSEHTARHFPIAIIGAGCAGLSLLSRLLQQPNLQGQPILLIDKGPKTSNDRTWCYWEKGPGYYDQLVYHSWPQLQVLHPNGAVPLALDGYQYKMIRGIDFYRHHIALLRQHPQVHLHYGEVREMDVDNGTITTDGGSFTADKIFSSVMTQPPQLKPHQYYLLQHFKGWVIETDTDVFDPTRAHLMNFCTSQQHGCAFVYFLPTSPRRALVEHTLFSESELDDADYDEALRQFMQQQLGLQHYRIVEVEKGIIPMTNLAFPQQEGRVTYIGTAGGQTKASTGYTFQAIQKHSQYLAQALEAGQPLRMPVPRRFGFYDSVLLRVLHQRKLSGADFFFQLFRRNPASRIFRFLDNDSHPGEELLLMHTTPKRIFIPAAMAELRHATVGG